MKNYQVIIGIESTFIQTDASKSVVNKYAALIESKGSYKPNDSMFIELLIGGGYQASLINTNDIISILETLDYQVIML